MRKFFQIIVLTFLTASFVISAWGQKQRSKDEYFKEIGTLSNTKKPEDMEKAYELAKEFVVKFPKENNENAKKLKDFIKRYRENKFYVTLEAKKFAEAFVIGKEILAEEPDNTSITMNLAYGGFDALARSRDKSFGDEAIKFGKQTLELLEKGSFPSSFAPFQNKEDAIAWMYYVIGTFSSEKDLREAAINFYKATLYESKVKNTSQPYFIIAAYYEQLFDKMSKDLNAKVTAKTISDADYKTENEKINKIINQMLDGYARAYTLGTAEKHPEAPAWKDRLTQVYQYQKKTTAGLDSFITYVINTPLADPSTF
jgi:hypothetical protein